MHRQFCNHVNTAQQINQSKQSFHLSRLNFLLFQKEVFYRQSLYSISVLVRIAEETRIPAYQAG